MAWEPGRFDQPKVTAGAPPPIARPLLLLDVGMARTGVARAMLTDHGPMLALDTIDPDRGLSPKSRNEARAFVKHGDAALRLFNQLRAEMEMAVGNDPRVIIVAEVPVMGARNAGAMRSMAMALACYRCALTAVPMARHFEFTRNDVMAACFPKKKPTGDGKAATRKLVRELLTHDDPDNAQPDDAYDAAALLFVAREHGVLQEAGWGDVKWR